MEFGIILAGGRGSRMNSDIPKQYMELAGKPLIYHTLKAFQESFMDELVVVCGDGDEEYVREQIVRPGGFDKVKMYAVGGRERYDSVYSGLQALRKRHGDVLGHVYVHDGARPCVDRGVLERCREAVNVHHACVAAVPVKDTIRVVNESGVAVETPDRRRLWQVQTPQAFDYSIVMDAYDMLAGCDDKSGITDDAMVVERFTDTVVHMSMGDYRNIKVTTPEDMAVAGLFLGM
jgi:2-C-methyl-D-erythritol 4-phosphate cytidylyltransferase